MKVIFIIHSIDSQRCFKRIQEFIDMGYDIEAYGFNRINSCHIKNENNIKINIIGNYPNSESYFKRLFIIRRSLKKIFSKYNNELFYYFSLDIAFIAKLINKNKYIYEEGDLAYTYFRNNIIIFIFKLLDKYIIKKSFESVLTSEGFLHYLFNNSQPKNVSIIPNRLNNRILKLLPIRKKKNNFNNNLKIGFVGLIRFNSIYHFAYVFSINFPYYEFHFFGNIINNNINFLELEKVKNIYFHGSFTNPKDLPYIYSKIDLVLSTYDIEFENIKYAEPNKLYEAIYFETPIIVTRGTFLAKKVDKLNIGYIIDPLNYLEIIKFIDELSNEDINNKIDSCRRINKMELINNNNEFFKKIQCLN